MAGCRVTELEVGRNSAAGSARDTEIWLRRKMKRRWRLCLYSSKSEHCQAKPGRLFGRPSTSDFGPSSPTPVETHPEINPRTHDEGRLVFSPPMVDLVSLPSRHSWVGSRANSIDEHPNTLGEGGQNWTRQGGGGGQTMWLESNSHREPDPPGLMSHQTSARNPDFTKFRAISTQLLAGRRHAGHL